MSDSSSATSIDRLKISYQIDVALNPIDYEREASLRKFLEYIGSEKLDGFVDFSEDIKGGEKYLNINVEYISENEILLNNHVHYLGEKSDDDLKEELKKVIDKSIKFSDKEDKKKEVFGTIFIVESEDRLKLMIKYEDKTVSNIPKDTDMSEMDN